MRIEINLKNAQKIFFTFWYVTLVIVVGYFILVEKKIMPSKIETLTVLVNVNFLAGTLFLATIATQIGAYVLRELLSFKLIFVLVIVAVGLFLFFRRQPALEEVQPVSTSMVISNAANDAKIFYLALFFEIFGYPEDEKMATSEELFEAVNVYRNDRGLKEIEQNKYLCQWAQDKMRELFSVVYTTRYDATKRYSPEGSEIKEIGEIDEVISRPSLASNLVEKRWARVFASPRDLLNDPRWSYGCGAIAGQTIVFLFGRE